MIEGAMGNQREMVRVRDWLAYKGREGGNGQEFLCSLTDWPLQTCPWSASWAYSHPFSEDVGIARQSPAQGGRHSPLEGEAYGYQAQCQGQGCQQVLGVRIDQAIPVL